MSECYFCGGAENLQEHHIIPDRYEPIRNETVRLCSGCHKKTHSLYSTLIPYILNNDERVSAVDTATTTERDRRQAEIETALGEPVRAAFESALGETNGRKHPALKLINDRLRQSDTYDEEVNG